jgi:basic membrane protein A and related proteins
MKQIMAIGIVICLIFLGVIGMVISSVQAADTPIKLDIVTCGPKTDGSWSQHLHDAYLNIKKKYPNIQVSWTDTLPFAEHLPVFESLASKKANLIYTSEVGFEAARELASKFPDTWFVIINLQPSHINEVPSNVTSYTVRAEEGGYLAGIAAGMMTKTNKIGHIAGMAYPCSIIPACGMAMGARSINPDITVTTVYLGSWNDPEKGYKAAKTLIDSGCDIILTMADDGNFGVINACKEKGVLMIGEARDMSEYAPDLFITSRLCPHPEMLEAAVEDYKSGKMKGNNVRYFGSKEGYDVISPLKNVPDEVKKKVAEVKAKIKSGELKVPVVYDADELDNFKNPPKK